MLSQRIIPCLLLKGNGLYKTTQFKNPIYLGDAVNVAKIFNEKFVDELIILDIDASKNNKEPNYDLIKDITSSCFIPVAYGGGVRSVESAQKLFSLGVEKVCLNTSAIQNPQLIRSLSDKFGSQSVVVSINLHRNWLGKLSVVNNELKKVFQGSVTELIQQYEELGAGEIFINDVDRDGMMKGFDIPLIRQISMATNVPLVVCGGAGSYDDLGKVLKEGGVSGVAAGSVFVFNGPRKAVLITYPTPSEIKSLLSEQ